MNEWISVDYELPDESEVIAYDGNSVFIACLDHIFGDNTWRNAIYMEQKGVTHWMPLPEQPEVEDDDEELICITCNGSGEGSHDGTTCRDCKGKGVEK